MCQLKHLSRITDKESSKLLAECRLIPYAAMYRAIIAYGDYSAISFNKHLSISFKLCMYQTNQQIPVKGQRANISDFVSFKESVTLTQLCCCSMKAAIENT